MLSLNRFYYPCTFMGTVWLLAMPVAAEQQYLEDQPLVYSIEGRAFSIDDSNKLLYIERYRAPDSNNQVQVDYFTPDEHQFAKKNLDYSSGLATPSYHLTDNRDNSENGARVGADTIEIFATSESASKQTILAIEKRQVVDAGFTQVVQDNWNTLLQGESLDIHFAFAAQQRNVKLTLEATTGEETPAYQRDADWQYFIMKISNRFLAMFVDSIYLAFDQNKKLMRYYGRSNLADDAGNNQDVLINYRYLQE